MKAVVALAAMLLMASPGSQAKRIFEVAESTTPAGSSRVSIQPQLTKLAPAKKDDYRVKYAYALALIHENRLTESLTVTGDLVKSHSKYLPARRTRAWLLLTLKRYPESLKELEALAMLLPDKEMTGDDARAYEEAAQFLGTAIGFLEGPVESSVSEPLRTKYKTRILDRLTGHRRDVFDEQIKAVSKQLAEFRQIEEQAHEKVTKKGKQALEDVEKKGEELAKAKADTQAQKEKTAQGLRIEWEQLTSDLAKATASYRQLEALALLGQNQRTQAASQLYALQNPPADSKGNIPLSAQNAYNRNGPGLRQTINSLDLQLAQAAVSMDQLVRNGAAIESKMMQTAVAGQQVGETFALQDQLFGKQAKLLAGRKKRVEKSVPEKSPKLNDRYRSFRMYDDFPYETEKQRILDSLAESNSQNTSPP